MGLKDWLLSTERGEHVDRAREMLSEEEAMRRYEELVSAGFIDAKLAPSVSTFARVRSLLLIFLAVGIIAGMIYVSWIVYLGFKATVKEGLQRHHIKVSRDGAQVEVKNVTQERMIEKATKKGLRAWERSDAWMASSVAVQHANEREAARKREAGGK
ncbi:hypothetical protein CJU89_1780 [Yarrowia sp. B02]|nr:hypothetical protein CJU89_1780 [Yarrowia sp. B02]